MQRKKKINSRYYKIAIIGGGASGLSAAITAGRILSGSDIVIIEKNDSLGRKINATGNGRCNFSNKYCDWQDYGGECKELIKYVIEKTGHEETVKFFESIGVLSREEGEGRLYPYSQQASAISEALQNEVKALQIQVILNKAVTQVKKTKGLFYLYLDDEAVIKADSIIVATGGKAGSQYGSTGDGFGIAKSFGHTLVSPLPGLVQMLTSDSGIKELKGVRAKGKVTLIQNNQVRGEELGEIQFTSFGLSGICIFDLSRYYKPQAGQAYIRIDLFSQFQEKELLEFLICRRNYLQERKAGDFLLGMMHKKLVPFYFRRWGMDESQSVSSIDNDSLKELVRILKCWSISITGTRGWSEAQVTLGGVRGSEVYAYSLESKLIPGLYFAGEVLDVDGKCGGWNLQWAWSSGYHAGLYAANRI